MPRDYPADTGTFDGTGTFDAFPDLSSNLSPDPGLNYLRAHPGSHPGTDHLQAQPGPDYL